MHQAFANACFLCNIQTFFIEASLSSVTYLRDCCADIVEQTLDTRYPFVCYCARSALCRGYRAQRARKLADEGIASIGIFMWVSYYTITAVAWPESRSSFGGSTHLSGRMRLYFLDKLLTSRLIEKLHTQHRLTGWNILRSLSSDYGRQSFDTRSPTTIHHTASRFRHLRPPLWDESRYPTLRCRCWQASRWISKHHLSPQRSSRAAFSTSKHKLRLIILDIPEQSLHVLNISFDRRLYGLSRNSRSAPTFNLHPRARYRPFNSVGSHQ